MDNGEVAVGTRVLAQWGGTFPGYKKGTCWYYADVSEYDPKKQLYTVRYEDDSIEKGIPREKIRIAGIESVHTSITSSSTSASKSKPAKSASTSTSKKKNTASTKKRQKASSSSSSSSSKKSKELSINILKNGIGELAGIEGDTIRVNYTAMIQDTGRYFLKETDYWIELGNKKEAGCHPNGLIAGILGMEFNETREIIVPPALGYGDRGKKKTGKMKLSIDPGATLVYKVRLYGHAKAGTTKMKIVTNVDTTGYEWN